MFGESLYLRDKLFGKNQSLTEVIRRGFLSYDTVRSFGVAHTSGSAQFSVRDMAMRVQTRFQAIRLLSNHRRWLPGLSPIASAARFDDVRVPPKLPDYTVMIPRRVSNKRRNHAV